MVVCVGLALAGCGNSATAVVDKPSDITLDSALASTVQAIYSSRKVSAELAAAEPDHIPLGMNVCTTTAVFNIAAGGTHTGTLNGTVGTPSNLYVSASVSGGVSDTQTANRGNQITVQFVSPACNPSGTLGTANPEKLTLLQQEIEAARDPGLPPLTRIVDLPNPAPAGRRTPAPRRAPVAGRHADAVYGRTFLAADTASSVASDDKKSDPAPTPPLPTRPFTPTKPGHPDWRVNSPDDEIETEPAKPGAGK